MALKHCLLNMEKFVEILYVRGKSNTLNLLEELETKKLKKRGGFMNCQTDAIKDRIFDNIL